MRQGRRHRVWRTVVTLHLLAVAALAGGLGSAAPSSAAGEDDTLPLSVRVTALEPAVLTPSSVVTLSGTLRNDGSRPVELRRVRLRTGRPLTSRAALNAFDARSGNGLAGVVGFGDPQQLEGTLAPGRSMPFAYSAPVDTLELGRLGIYPIELSVRGVVDGSTVTAPVGSVVTYLPWFPEQPRARIHVGWIWPIMDVPHRSAASSLLLDDTLATSLARNGRLDILLGAAERATEGPRPTPLTLAVDADLVETVTRMADGYRFSPRPGLRLAGRGQAAARAWLDRLRSLVQRVPVIAVPYGDPDVVALDRAGLRDDADGAATYAENALASRLRVEPLRGVSWPPGGVLTDSALDWLVARGTRTILLSEASLPLKEGSVTPGARSPLAAVGGEVTALVVDNRLESLLSSATVDPGGPRLASQRLLAEVAMIAAQSPSRARSVLVAPPRRWAPSAALADRLLEDSATVPWAQPATLAEIAGSAAVARGPLRYPATARAAELSPSYLRSVERLSRQLDVVRGALSNDSAQRLLTPYRLGQWRAESSAWRGHSRLAVRYTQRVSRDVQGLEGRVRIVSSGTFSLASTTSPLVVTVANDLGEPVTVRVGLSAGAGTGFRASASAPQTIGPRRRQTFRVSAAVERSGSFTVSARLLTSEGQTLGKPVDLRVRSTAYGRLALGITGTALGVLLLAVGLRLWRRTRRPPTERPAVADPPSSGAPAPGALRPPGSVLR